MEATWTDNHFKDVIDNINKGIIMVFWDDTRISVYHECKRQYIIPTETVVYVDCRHSNLFSCDRLDSLSANQCKCNIRDIVKTKAKFGKVQYAKAA